MRLAKPFIRILAPFHPRQGANDPQRAGSETSTHRIGWVRGLIWDPAVLGLLMLAVALLAIWVGDEALWWLAIGCVAGFSLSGST